MTNKEAIATLEKVKLYLTDQQEVDQINFAIKVLEWNSQGDLISREALKDIEYINKGNFNSVEGIWKWIDNAPTVDLLVARETNGTVIPMTNTSTNICNRCGKLTDTLRRYCPNCGALI